MNGNVDYVLIGSRIKSARRDLSMTQEQLAEKLEVSVGYVSQVERGITRISLDLLGAISQILGRNIAWFVDSSAVSSESYLGDEFFKAYSGLAPRDKRVVLGLIDLFREQRP